MVDFWLVCEELKNKILRWCMHRFNLQNFLVAVMWNFNVGLILDTMNMDSLVLQPPYVFSLDPPLLGQFYGSTWCVNKGCRAVFHIRWWYLCLQLYLDKLKFKSTVCIALGLAFHFSCLEASIFNNFLEKNPFLISFEMICFHLF